MPGRATPFQTSVDGMSDGSASYRYGFNGKENDFEPKNSQGSQQDYGMRIYDPRLGRFLSVDPLSPEYPWYTPYQFAGNKPIRCTDLDGAEEMDAIYGDNIGVQMALITVKAWDDLVDAFGNTLLLASPELKRSLLILKATEEGYSSIDGLTIRKVNRDFVLQNEPGAGRALLDAGLDLLSVALAMSPAKVGTLSSPALLAARAPFISNAVVSVVRSAEKVNSQFLRAGKYAAYKAGTKVIEYTSKAQEKFVRLSNSSLNNSTGDWLVKKADIEGLSPQQIKDKLSLGYVPDQISDVTVGAGSTLRTGVAAPVKELNTSGGGIQYELLNKKNVSYSTPKKIE